MSEQSGFTSVEPEEGTWTEAGGEKARAESSPEQDSREEGYASDGEGEAEAASEPVFDPEKGRTVAQLLKVLRERQSERDGRREGLAGHGATESPETAEEEVAEHPALAGLPRGVDEAGNELVEFQGAWVPPDFVVDLYEQAQRLHDGGAEAQWQTEQQQLLGQFEQAAVELLSDTRRRAFPGLSEEQGALLDELLLPYADTMLSRLDWEGMEEGELLGQIETVGRETMGRVRDLFTLAAAQQLADNTQYHDAYRVRPDGTPGARAPEGADIERYLRLPVAARRGIMQRAAEAANALREPIG